jgi:hypothetical protein
VPQKVLEALYQIASKAFWGTIIEVPQKLLGAFCLKCPKNFLRHFD